MLELKLTGEILNHPGLLIDPIENDGGMMMAKAVVISFNKNVCPRQKKNSCESPFHLSGTQITLYSVSC